jgi:hypothetical protein
MLLVAATPGCTDHKDPAAPTMQGLELHLTTSFENDYVGVKLDDRQVFGGSATTAGKCRAASAIAAWSALT